MARRELTSQEMAGVYPELVSKRPELLNRLSKRGVKYYIDPLLEQKKGYGGEYNPAEKSVTLQTGMVAGVAGHEIVHADLDTSWVNPARFLLDKRYRAARSADLITRGGLMGTALGLYLLAGSGRDAKLAQQRIAKASLQSEVFAMGAYGSEAYSDLPIDYTDANRLFGGSFEGR